MDPLLTKVKGPAVKRVNRVKPAYNKSSEFRLNRPKFEECRLNSAAWGDNENHYQTKQEIGRSSSPQTNNGRTYWYHSAKQQQPLQLIVIDNWPPTDKYISKCKTANKMPW